MDATSKIIPFREGGNVVAEKKVVITKKITGLKVIKPGEAQVAPAPAPQLADDNPITKRIAKRPEGFLDAMSCKMSYTSQNGPEKSIYFVLAFMPVKGVVNGKEITIERPMECFVPPGQRTDDQQWIAGLMRVLSKTARNGMFVEALQQLREVVSANGSLQLSWTPDSHNKFHDSVVASVAYMMQEALKARGFIDQYGRVMPLEKLAESYANRHSQNGTDNAQEDGAMDLTCGEAEPHSDLDAETAPFGRCEHPECNGQPLRMLDGCKVCTSCASSKCQ